MPKHKLTRAQIAQAAVPAVPVVVPNPPAPLKPSEARERAFVEALKHPGEAAEEMHIPFKLLPEHGILYSKPTIIKMVREGRFPRPYEMSPRRKVWKLSDITRWKATRPAWRVVPAIQTKSEDTAR
jgi:hypothetical protein